MNVFGKILIEFNVTAPDVLIFQRESKAFSGEGGYVGADYDVTGAGAPFHAAAERVTASLFPVLGIDPLLGRTFTQKEDENCGAGDRDQLFALARTIPE